MSMITARRPKSSKSDRRTARPFGESLTYPSASDRRWWAYESNKDAEGFDVPTDADRDAIEAEVAAANAEAASFRNWERERAEAAAYELACEVGYHTW